MKRIGIITFHESDNYGTVLQAYALQQLICGMGYDADIINYVRPGIKQEEGGKESLPKRLISALKAYGLLNIHMRSAIKDSQKKVKDKFQKFRSEHYIYSKDAYHSFDELKDIADKYDAFVVGSDMVWSFDRSQNLDLYFLKFADSKKRIAYSPSFGTTAIDENQKQEYIMGLQNFSSLSCREASGVQLIKELTGKNAMLTADPTIACERSVWDKFSIDYAMPQRYILVYMFEGLSDKLRSELNVLSRTNNLEIIEIPVEIKGWCRALRNHSNMIVGPEEFVELFKNATCVVTNSYHGLIFSIIFSKPFLVIQRKNQRWGQFEDRLTDMLKRFGCEDRLIANDMHINNNLLFNSKIALTENVEKLRLQSIEYLKQAFKKI